MKLLAWGFILALSGSLTSCFWRTEKSPAPAGQPSPVTSVSALRVPTPSVSPKKDRTLEIFVKYFEQADAIHREAWWVLTAERRSPGKSPFGKVQRAILSSQNVKLSNKSAFRCDRYIFKRDVLGASGFPQKAEVYEKCSDKIAAKKIAEFYSPSSLEIQATFFPENLEEILGLGATVLNRSIKCTLKGNSNEQLEHLNCIDWAQDRTKDQMIRLDDYEYTRSGKNLIKLRGKVYENLTDTRKIEADVPMEGKILVKETELYPPEPTPTPSVKPTPAKSAQPVQRPANAPPLELRPEEEGLAPGAEQGWPEGEAPPVSIIPLPGQPGLPAPRKTGPVVDPDVLMMQQQQQQQPQQQLMENPEAPEAATEMGEPSAEAPEMLEYEQQQLQQQQQLEQQPQQEGEVHGR